MASCKPNMESDKGFLMPYEDEESECCQAQSQSALRIVLLGVRWAGKSSAGNIILGREEFDSRVGTVHCVKRQGETAGRQLVVVDTSGWVWHSAQDATIRVEQEIACSVSLCHPGPHAILLVIPMGSPGKRYKKAVRKHLELLSETVWNHTIVLFTKGDTTDLNIEKGGKRLQLLLEKCGNRYHILDNKSKDNCTQVTELLEKIEEMVGKNGDGYYEIQNKGTERSVKRRGKVEWKVWRHRGKPQQISQDKDTQTEAEQFRASAMLPSEKIPINNLPEVRIVLLGERGAGKSTIANIILGRELFNTERVTGECQKKTGQVAGQEITVVDTPGWNGVSEHETLDWVKEEIVQSVNLCPPGPHALLLVIPVGSSMNRKTTVKKHLELLSGRVWRHTIVLFSRTKELGEMSISQHIERDKDLQWIVEKCGNRYHVINDLILCDGTQVTQLLTEIEEMVEGNGGWHFSLRMYLELEKQIIHCHKKREKKLKHMKY
ncbi:hypothetical protein COCON_G00033760 [Conger conger]|uniref:AIG1-type G domain-containing protein n=1 Tax=Conger conger TaxID=82655 RepID=A0A9Q1DZB6_CONCO|nr:GTPase IMAP family member 8-like [Conger conger]KAJ8284526.1 hypothetical protein COCON_G00033760 [Conger conger]